MYFKMPCWNCGRHLRASDENIGKKAKCPYCGSVGEIARPDVVPAKADMVIEGAAEGEGISTETPVGTLKTEGGQSRGTNVSLAVTAAIAVVVTVVFYVAVIFPLPDNPIRRLFAGRGVVPYVITLFTLWAWTMLLLKYLKMRIQRTALLFDVLPTEVADDIHPDNVETFRSNILSLPIEPEKSFLIGRVLRALTHYKAHPTRESVSTLLANQSDIDANIVDGSYTMIKVLVWAIPILGFIGTVMGVGGAVGGFSTVIEQAANFEAAKSGLTRVTSQLGVAFDTTLLALVLSLFVMFPASALQKNEEDLLASVDQYCSENVLRRLHSLQPGSSAPVNLGPGTGIIDGILADRIRELEAWSSGLQKLSTTLTENIADAWSKVKRSAEQAHREQIQTISDSCDGMVASAGKLEAQLAGADRNAAALSDAQERLVQLNKQLVENIDAVSGGEDLKKALLGIEHQLARNSEVMASMSGNSNLIEVLERIGQQLTKNTEAMRSVPDNQAGSEDQPMLLAAGDEGPPRRRWWPFSRKGPRG